VKSLAFATDKSEDLGYNSKSGAAPLARTPSEEFRKGCARGCEETNVLTTLGIRFGLLVGICTAALACSKPTSQSPTSPSGALPGSTAAEGGGSTLKTTAPALISPVDGVTIDSRQPTLVWANSVARYEEIGLAYEVEVSDIGKVVYTQVVGETPNVGQHKIDLQLAEDTGYYWRIRSRLSTAAGPWSGYGEFRTLKPVVVIPTSPTTPTGTAFRTPDPPAGQRLPRRNDLGTVLAVSGRDSSLLRQSCQDDGGNWRLMDAVVDGLRTVDMRYGYNCKRGNCNDTSKDVVSYHWGAGPDEGSTQVYCTDIISGHCGPAPSLFWSDVTDITYNSGTVCKVTATRPGRTSYPYPPS